MNDAIGAAVDARHGLAGAGERVNDVDTDSERAWSPYPALAQIVRVLRRMGASEVRGAAMTHAFVPPRYVFAGRQPCTDPTDYQILARRSLSLSRATS